MCSPYSIIICASIALSFAPLPAVAKVEWLRSNVQFFTMKEQPKTVTISAKITPTPDHVPDSVRCVRYTATPPETTDLGPLYDDGTNGDSTAGDGIYTGNIIFGETTPTYIDLAIATTYPGQPSSIEGHLALVVRADTTCLQAAAQLSNYLVSLDRASALPFFYGARDLARIETRLSDDQLKAIGAAFARARYKGNYGSLCVLTIPFPNITEEVDTLWGQKELGDWRLISW